MRTRQQANKMIAKEFSFILRRETKETGSWYSSQSSQVSHEYYLTGTAASSGVQESNPTHRRGYFQ
jgi:hypothetical protein